MREENRNDEQLRRELIELTGDVGETDDLLDSADLLDDIGAEARQVLAEVGRMDSVPGERAAEEHLRRLMAENRPPQAWGLAPILRIAAGLAAAAALVLLLLHFSGDAGEEGGGRGGTLGGGSIRLLEPPAEVGAWGEFRWTGPAPGSGRYEVVVYPGDDVTAEPIARALNLKEPRWEPTDTSLWPDRIAWEVRLLDVNGELLDSAEAESERR
ncbi:MAG: hypothetical protein AAF682_24915 [Planctomycetota bacterium]